MPEITDHAVPPPPPETKPLRPEPVPPSEPPSDDRPGKGPTPQQAAEFAKTQAEQRGELYKKQAKAKSSAKNGAAAAAAAEAAAQESTELEEKLAKEKAEFDPSGQVKLPVFNGMAIQAAVAALHDELSAMAGEHNFEVGELRNFGTEFDVFDPVTGMLVSPARAHRRDVGDAGQLMTAAAVVSDIVSARAHQMTAGVTQYAADRVV